MVKRKSYKKTKLKNTKVESSYGKDKNKAKESNVKSSTPEAKLLQFGSRWVPMSLRFFVLIQKKIRIQLRKIELYYLAANTAIWQQNF